MATINIEITETPPGAENKRIKKSAEDHVKWWSKSDDWVVVFKGETPFERAYYTPKKDKSEKIEVEAGETKYEYMVGINGKRFNSPWIIIDG